ncbi:hypothetical protein [Brevibacillus porteri]|uniref:Transcriptional regulator n=1 Tax=Brevibacillus porteri TaxID=2126350 RepID=A0ABX5FH09_9BACL|nr:hypothetical protein [Brevibacillus porteri]MED1801797.1 hypothetical protein [Brevibacillus porteri]MED2134928.1 hypothetical protein [Brevibacillus porteri]MED2748435.1 hypothetical protein [Brevibacillus porteri]MED2818359.1 hypothetical protein [Brevibacillus porteri]MED2897682.1 hypothetical protein [Brevibacillus porteri]
MNQKMMEHVTKISAEAAVQAALEFLEKEKQKQQKEKRDWRLRNTKLLLKHYRSFVRHVDGTMEKVTAHDYAEAIGNLHSQELALESIKRSTQRTMVMVKFVQRMLSVYETTCLMSEHPEDWRRYQIIHDLYISEEKKTVEQVATCHFIDTRTVYRDINEATKALSVLIFGVDAIDFM